MSESNSINFFREAAPYIQAHKGKTFVIAIGSTVLASKKLDNILQDIAILSTLGIKLVLVYGTRLHINQQLQQQKAAFDFYKRYRITTPKILEVSQSVVGRLRVMLESHLSYALNKPALINQSLAVISGSFITAKPIGICDGIDYQYTGKVRKIANIQIQQQLDHHAIVLLAPLGLSPSGESYNLLYKDVAVQTAKALHADKLIFLQPLSSDLPRQLTLQQAKEYTIAHHLMDYIDTALAVGVKRVHLINALHNGSLLSELYTRDGAGTLISNDQYDALNQATIDDISGIIDLIRPLEKKGVLIRRSREQLELEIDNFIVIKRDQKVIACAALYPMKVVKSAELACFVVDNHYRGQAKGDLLLDFIENRAKVLSLKQLIVLTTQTTDWFRERGFTLGQVNDLPEEKKKLYNYQRNSRILLKTLI